MRTVTEIAELRTLVAARRGVGQSVGLVPTMGNLHAGHYSLIDQARREGDFVVASVFVNPTQFAPNEDFSRYPRTPEQDAAGLAERGCDVLFLPDVDTMYPFGVAEAAQVEVFAVTDTLEGAIRPGHFTGVSSVVARLFNLVQPDFAVFGQKDYQQLLVIRRMSQDLGFPVRIVSVPIMREANGLAMSSRNQYLDASQRQQAAVIHATLLAMGDAMRAGHDRVVVESTAAAQLRDAGFEPDYAVIRRAGDLGMPDAHARNDLVALIAARCGQLRLIDNLLLDV